nr:hypothetical protein [uncultured Psychroserpens sp.]
MAPIKFEDTIKDKLEKRTLQPSHDAWSQLSTQLDAEDKKNSRSLFFYIGIAASIVGVLLVTTLFFKSSEEQTLVPALVETAFEMPEEKNGNSINSNASDRSVTTTNIDHIQNENNIKETVSQNHTSNKNQLTVAVVSEEQKMNKQLKNNVINTSETKTSVAVVNNSEEAQKTLTTLNELTFEEAKAIEVVEHIKKLEIEKGSVSDAEIEDLLKQAEKEILRQRIYNETTRTVDAEALLQDVEDDLERSFRTRVFETLKSSYKTVKTAVAERNN